jgi:hypothetical protein
MVAALQPPCILVILVILDHSLIFRVIIPDVLIQLSFRGWAHSCSKHVKNSNKHLTEEIMHQVGYLPELYKDAGSKRFKIIDLNFVIISSTVYHCKFPTNHQHKTIFYEPYFIKSTETAKG